VLTRPCLGIRVDDVSAPVKGGLADVTIHATLAPEARILWAACGDMKVDYSKETVSTIDKPIEITFQGVAVVPGEKLEVEVGLAGQQKPQRLVALSTTQGDELKPERAKPAAAEKR